MFLHANIWVSVASSFLICGLTWFVYKFRLHRRLFYSVNAESSNHGGHLVADVLKSHGVSHVFTLTGGHISPILVACERLGIKIIDVRHEATAAFAADAVARCSGAVGVACVTAGPGLTNTVTAIKNAQMAESPILLIGGAAAGLLKGRGALQDIDQMALFKPLCKFTASISRVVEIVPTLKRAFYEAQSGVPGPVFVEMPIDVLYPYHVIRREIGISEHVSRSISQWIVNVYLENYLFNLFANAFVARDGNGSSYAKFIAPVQPNIPMPKQKHVLHLKQLILQSERPLFIFGSQAVLPPVAATDLADIVKKIGIPCFLGGMSRGLLGSSHEIFMRQKRRNAIKEADLIILAGAVCDFRLSYGRVFSRSCTIVSINRNADNLKKNSDLFWNATLAIEADVGTTLMQLQTVLQDWGPSVSWMETLRQRDDEAEEKNSESCEERTVVHLNPIKVLSVLEDEGLSDDAILVADGGDFVGTASYVLRPRGPLKWLDPGAFGTLGVGGGFALGVKLCNPQSDVWVIYGDGALGFSIAEFDTFVRHEIPIIALVGNDACWTQIAREQITLFSSTVGCELDYCSYERAVEGFGAVGLLLNRDNEDSMKEVFLRAIDITKREKKPVLINCLIGKTSFRDGSISA